MKRKRKIWKIILVIGLSAIFIYKNFFFFGQECVTAKKIISNNQPAVQIPTTKHSNKIKNNVFFARKHVICPKHYFKITGMTKCHKWLDCEEIQKMALNLRNYNVIGKGQSKKVLVYL